MVDVVTKRNYYFYQTAYHVIWCPKYRRNVLIGAVAEETGAMLDAICIERSWPVISKEIQPDHIHLFVSTETIRRYIERCEHVTKRR